MQGTRRMVLFFTILFLLIKAKYYNGQPVNVRLYGFKINANSPQTLLILIKEIFIDQVYKFESKNPAPKIIDAGANVGISVLYFKSLYPEAKIIAFEPNPEAFAYLYSNIKQNGLRDVQAVNACLSDQSGKAKFYFSPKANIINGSLYPETGISYMQEVEAVRLSDYLRHDAVALVKIYVEGAERLVLRDLENSGMMSQSGQYLLEYHSGAGLPDIYDALTASFRQNGFKAQAPNQGDPENMLMHYIQVDQGVMA